MNYDASTTSPSDPDAPSLPWPASALPPHAPAGPHREASEGAAAEHQDVVRPANRSRARAFSFLSVHADAAADAFPPPRPGIPSPALTYSAEAPFAGGTYESALDDDADDGDLDSDGDTDRLAGSRHDSGQTLAMNRLGQGVAPIGGKTVYRVRFQPLDSLELAWMAVSAFLVLGLTVTSLIVAFVG